MKGRLVAATVALSLALPVAGVAEDSPWSAIRKLFHEPVAGLKQQLEQFRAAVPAAGAAKPVPAEDVATESTPPKAEPPKPDLAEPKAATPEAVATTGDSVPTAPIPRPRPDSTFSYAADEPPIPAQKPALAAIGALTPPGPSLIVPPPAARSTCGAALARLGVEASPIAPISEGACGIAQPVAVASLGSGAVDLTVKAIIACDLAETFANWIDDEVQPEARKILGGAVTGLRIAASYHCRSRNGVVGAKLSEHGKGNAIDVAAFKVDGHGWIEVGGAHAGDEARFLRTVRTAACNPFTTVLGPGSDAYHSDHFHLDLAQRSKRGKSKGLYCQ